MEAKRSVDLVEKRLGNAPQSIPDSTDVDRSDLLGLSFGVNRQLRLGSRDQDLKGVDAGRVGCERNDGDRALTQLCGGLVGGVVADDHSWAGFVRLGPDRRF